MEAMEAIMGTETPTMVTINTERLSDSLLTQLLVTALVTGSLERRPKGL